MGASKFQCHRLNKVLSIRSTRMATIILRSIIITTLLTYNSKQTKARQTQIIPLRHLKACSNATYTSYTSSSSNNSSNKLHLTNSRHSSTMLVSTSSYKHASNNNTSCKCSSSYQNSTVKIIIITAIMVTTISVIAIASRLATRAVSRLNLRMPRLMLRSRQLMEVYRLFKIMGRVSDQDRGLQRHQHLPM